MHKVSIIIPNYNHSVYLKQRIESVLNQTYQDFEVILLDDCSTDNSGVVLSGYAKHPKVAHLIINTNNSGSTFKQWEKGIKLAQGKYIWIAESDDFANLCFLEKLVPIIESNPKIGIAYCQSYKVDENGMNIGNMIEWTNDLDNARWKTDYTNNGLAELEKYFIYKNTIPNASAAIFRKAAIVLNRKLHKFFLCGDKYFYTQILLRNDIAFCAEPLNYYRFHTNTVRKKINHYNLLKEVMIWLRLVFYHIEITPAIKYKILDKSWGFSAFFILIDNSYSFHKKLCFLLFAAFTNKMFFFYMIKMFVLYKKNKMFEQQTEKN